MTWCPVDSIDPKDLLDARLELHHAAQLVAIGVAKSLIPARDDDSHTVLRWDPDARCWLSGPIPDSDGLRAGLAPATMTLRLGSATFALPGRTLQDAINWLRTALSQHGLSTERVSMEAHYDMPDHAVAGGAPFSASVPAGCIALAAYYGHAHALVTEAISGLADASSVVTWPHHFDLASLRALGKRNDDACSIGIGFSPGDGNVDEPYFYVTPWPVPDDDDASLPGLPAGHWRRKNFFGALLPISEALATRDPTATVRGYLDSAIRASERWLADCNAAEQGDNA